MLGQDHAVPIDSDETTALHPITARWDGDGAKKQRAQPGGALAGAQEELAGLTG